MRATSFFAALLMVVAAIALYVSRGKGDEARAPRHGTVTLLGDSLNLGVERYLPAALPGWKLAANDRVGRATPEGIDELESGRVVLSNYVVVSLGTNDPPSETAAFRRDVARVLRLVGTNRCVVWATIWRDGAPNDAFNAILRAATRSNERLALVDWAEMVKTHPELLAGDGLHGNEDGYRARARAVAAAVQKCAPAQSVSAG